METLNDKLDKQQAETGRQRRLLARFPDLHEYKGRWRTVLVSKTANPLVDQYEIRRTCGCCRDAPVVSWCSLKTADGEVYSDPPEFRVAYWDDWATERTKGDNWRGVFEKAGIPTELIDQIDAVVPNIRVTTTTTEEEF